MHRARALRQVRLTYASRDERQILYREVLHELLRAHAPRFEVRHCLSRPEQRLGDSEGGESSASEGLATGDTVTGASCVAGERQTRGRVDAATLHEEYAAWRPSRTAYVDASGAAEASDKREEEGEEAEGEPFFLVVGSRDSAGARRLAVAAREWPASAPTARGRAVALASTCILK